MEKKPKIAILGGGVGGLVCAAELNYRLGTKAQILLFDKNAHHIFQPALLHLALGQRRLENISRPLDRLDRQGVRFLHGEVYRIDPKNLVINSAHGDFELDYLIVALGSDFDFEAVDGFEENTLNLYSVEGARKIAHALEDFNEGIINIVVASAVFKGPTAPYEMAFLLDSYLRGRKIRDKVKVNLITPEFQPLPLCGGKAGNMIAKALTEREIEYMPNTKVKSISNMISIEKKKLKTDLTIGIPAHKCPEVITDCELANEGGWVDVNKFSLETEFENVYALGDNVDIKLSAGSSVPKTGEVAKDQAQVVAYNLAHKITKGKVVKKDFSARDRYFFEFGDKRAAIVKCDYYHEPDPKTSMKKTSRINYLKKLFYEKYWLNAWL